MHICIFIRRMQISISVCVCVCVCCFLFIFHFICFDTEIGQLAKILSAGQIDSVRPNAPKQPEYTCRFVEWKLCDWKIKKHRLDSVVVNIYVVIGWHFNSTASKLYRVPILRCTQVLLLLCCVNNKHPIF